MIEQIYIDVAYFAIGMGAGTILIKGLGAYKEKIMAACDMLVAKIEVIQKEYPQATDGLEDVQIFLIDAKSALEDGALSITEARQLYKDLVALSEHAVSIYEILAKKTSE